jgi:hypothetical protein
LLRAPGICIIITTKATYILRRKLYRGKSVGFGRKWGRFLTLPRWWMAAAQVPVSLAQDRPAQPLALPGLTGTMPLEPRMGLDKQR